jgi:flagellar motor switch protein FliG
VGNLHIKSFVDTVLKGAAGKEKADEFKTQMKKALTDKDPYIAIGSASPPQIVAALQGEPPQAIAMVLSNLPPKLGTEILNRLDEEIANKTVWRMTKPGEVSAKIVHRIGEMVCKKLVELTSEEGIPFEEALPKDILRKVAIVLSGLSKEKRDALMEGIQTNDSTIALTVKALMVTWEDIIKVEDRSLQESLRKVDAGVLAKALFGADLIIAEKIRSNISERASEMVDEETALMTEPRKKDVVEARDKVVNPLRDANESEELRFIEE